MTQTPMGTPLVPGHVLVHQNSCSPPRRRSGRSIGGKMTELFPECSDLLFPLSSAKNKNILNNAFNSKKNLLGEGSFGAVYRMETSDGKEFAVKRVAEPKSQTEKMERRYEAFCGAWIKKTSTKNPFFKEVSEKVLCQHFQWWERENGSLCLRTELCEPFSLPITTDTHQKLVETLWRYMAEASVATFALHYCGILHLDLKPSNFLLSKKLIFDENNVGRRIVKLADFGSCLFLEAGQKEKPLSIIRTEMQDFCYCSLEVFDEGVATISSDLFSLGLTFWSWVTGETAPRDSSQWRMIREDCEPLSRLCEVYGASVFDASEEMREIKLFVSQFLMRDWRERIKTHQIFEHEKIKFYGQKLLSPETWTWVCEQSHWPLSSHSPPLAFSPLSSSLSIPTSRSISPSPLSKGQVESHVRMGRIVLAHDPQREKKKYPAALATSQHRLSFSTTVRTSLLANSPEGDGYLSQAFRHSSQWANDRSNSLLPLISPLPSSQPAETAEGMKKRQKFTVPSIQIIEEEDAKETATEPFSFASLRTETPVVQLALANMHLGEETETAKNPCEPLRLVSLSPGYLGDSNSSSQSFFNANVRIVPEKRKRNPVSPILEETETTDFLTGEKWNEKEERQGEEETGHLSLRNLKKGVSVTTPRTRVFSTHQKYSTERREKHQKKRIRNSLLATFASPEDNLFLKRLRATANSSTGRRDKTSPVNISPTITARTKCELLLLNNSNSKNSTDRDGRENGGGDEASTPFLSLSTPLLRNATMRTTYNSNVRSSQNILPSPLDSQETLSANSLRYTDRDVLRTRLLARRHNLLRSTSNGDVTGKALIFDVDDSLRLRDRKKNYSRTIRGARLSFSNIAGDETASLESARNKENLSGGIGGDGIGEEKREGRRGDIRRQLTAGAGSSNSAASPFTEDFDVLSFSTSKWRRDAVNWKNIFDESVTVCHQKIKQENSVRRPALFLSSQQLHQILTKQSPANSASVTRANSRTSPLEQTFAVSTLSPAKLAETGIHNANTCIGIARENANSATIPTASQETHIRRDQETTDVSALSPLPSVSPLSSSQGDTSEIQKQVQMIGSQLRSSQKFGRMKLRTLLVENLTKKIIENNSLTKNNANIEDNSVLRTSSKIRHRKI